MPNTFATLSADVAAVGGLDYTSESTASDRWAKGGLRLIGRTGAWEWLHAHTSIGLVASQYNYALETYASDLQRIDTRTIRYGSQYIKWGHITRIDELLGPSWKDAGATEGTPEYMTRVGGELWLARTPTAAFVAANPNVSFYYWKSEAFTDAANILLPDDFYECAIDASLAFGFTQEDDPRGDALLRRVMDVHIPEMRGFNMLIGSKDRMADPRHFIADESRLDGYGDGWVSEIG